MKSRITYLVFVLALFFLLSPWGEGPGVRCSAQTVTPTFIGSTGGSGTVTPTMYISYSVGEAVISTFSLTGTPPIKYLTQGFQQPEPQSCPQFSASTPFNISNNDSICSGNSVTIAANLTTTGVYTYTWSSGQSTSAINVNPTVSTTYTLIVAEGACKDTGIVTIEVSSPSVAAGGINTICNGQSTTLSVSVATGGFLPYTYSWNPPGASTTAITVTPTSTTNYTLTLTDKIGCMSVAVYTVTVTSPATLTVTATNETCAGLCNGSATAAAAGGSLPYTYLWSSGGTTSSVSNLCAAVYSATVTTSDGCSVNSSASVVSPLALTATPGSNATICNGSSAVLDVTAGGGTGVYTYSWLPGSQTTSAITVSPTATTGYTVMVTDANLCTAQATNTVMVNSAPTPTVSATPNPVCEGGSMTLTATGGAGTYDWTGPNGYTSASQNPTITSVTASHAGTYSVTETISGCVSLPGIITITVDPSPAAPSASASPNPVCAGATLSLSAGNIGGATYAWTGPNSFTDATQNPTIGSITTAGSGTYSVTATVSGCVGPAGIVSVTVNPLPTVPNAGTDQTVCGDVATFAGNNPSIGTGTWFLVSGPGGANFLNVNSAVSTVTVTLSGSYTFRWSIASGTCTSIDDVDITFNPVPATPAASASPNPVCVGSDVSLNSNTIGGATYSWSGPNSFTSGAEDPVVATAGTAASGTYSVFVTTLGCTSPTATVSVTVDPIPTPSINAAPSLTICDGDLLTLTASGGSNYSWSHGIGVALTVVTPSSNIAYSVTVAIGTCSAIATVSVTVNPTPTVTINGGADATICSGQSVTLNASATGGGPFSYSWAPNTGLSNSSISNPTASPGVSQEYTLVVTNANSCSTITTTSVTVNPIATLSLSATNVLCALQCNGSATVTPTSGNPPFNYLWSSGGTNSSIANLCAGPQSVTVTASGCTATGTISITEPTVLTTGSISSSPTACGCTGTAGVTPAGGTTPYTYSWSGPSFSATTSNISGLCGGSYSLVVTDSNGCSSSATTTLTASPGVSVTATFPATICAGSSATIGVNATTATGGLSYTWMPAVSSGSTATVTPTAPTTYTVIVKNIISGCEDTAFVAVNVNALPAVSITGAGTICSGSSATLTATGGATYAWSAPGGTTNPLVVTPSSPTGYTVTATDNNGCSDTASAFVFVTTAPTASISVGPGSTICSGTVLTLTASGGSTYFWINNSLSVSSFTVAPTASITYTLVAYNGACTDTAMLAITISSVSVTVSGANSLCIGQNTTLTATPTGGSGAYTYSWNTTPPQTTPSIVESYTAVGTYNYAVTVTDATGCNGSATYSVVVNSLPSVSISASDSTVCAGSPSILTANPTTGVTYAWSTAETNNPITVSPLSPTGYTVTVSNGSCSSAASINIAVNTLPIISAGANPTAICAGDTVILSASGGTTYLWSTGATSASTLDMPLVNTTYTVVGTDAAGCSNFATTSVTLNTVSVNAGPDITICPGFTAALSAAVTGNVASYMWSPGSLMNDSLTQNPSAAPVDSATTFIVTVSDLTGLCSAKDSVTVYSIRTPDCVIKIYNGITPNGDNDNNVWFIDGIQSYPENKVYIFNRWGTKVWSASGYNNTDVVWKGTDQQGNALSDGTYYYLVELFDGQGGTIFSESSWVEVTH